MNDSFEITYAVHTASCTFLLDAEGICRRIVLASSGKRSVRSRARDAARAAARCVGAQYVACLDASVSGLMAEKPRPGGAMLFARVDERGRVSLVRTGVITRFETLEAEDPFAAGDPASSLSVETSAPPLPSSAPDGTADPDDPYGDDLDRTQPVHALPLHRVARMLRPDDDPTLERTTEYAAWARRSRWASEPTDDASAPTLRHASVPAPPPSESDPYAPRARGMLPRRTEPNGRSSSRPGTEAEPRRARSALPYGTANGRRR